jgi:hypothetical protein
MFSRYIFPGLALGAALGQTGVVTNAMINRSAEALVELISEDDLARRATFPEGYDIRAISSHLAVKVILQAIEEGLKVSGEEGQTSHFNIGFVFCAETVMVQCHTGRYICSVPDPSNILSVRFFIVQVRNCTIFFSLD